MNWTPLMVRLREFVKSNLCLVFCYMLIKASILFYSFLVYSIFFFWRANYDVIICDTAGRLQTKINLMNEASKMVRVIQKVIPEGPHETFLVIDATTGQNGVYQARAFAEVSDVTGIILTKMDGTSKGGIILSIKDQLDIPVRYVGLGEQIDDLEEFDLMQYLNGLVGLDEEDE